LSLVNTGIVVALRLVGIAVLIVIHLPLVIAGVVVAGIIIVRIGIIITVRRRAVAIIRKAIVVVVVVIVRVVRRPPRRKSQIKDHPRSINEGASVTIPPVVAIAVPIAMPIP